MEQPHSHQPSLPNEPTQSPPASGFEDQSSKHGSEAHNDVDHSELEEDLFGDGDDADEDVDEDVENDVPETELRKREALEYEEDQEYNQDQQLDTIEKHIAEAVMFNLPLPYSSDGKVRG